MSILGLADFDGTADAATAAAGDRLERVAGMVESFIGHRIRSEIDVAAAVRLKD